MYTFEIKDNMIPVIDSFISECNKEAVERQRNTMSPTDPSYDIASSFWELGYPYDGACGGSTTFSFTPTSLGVICTVTYLENTEFQKKMDITDYDEW